MQLTGIDWGDMNPTGCCNPLSPLKTKRRVLCIVYRQAGKYLYNIYDWYGCKNILKPKEENKLI